MRLPKYKVIFRYKNITLWKYNKVLTGKLTSRKWLDLNNKKFRRHFKGNAYYICHYKKLKIERIYYFKFINKQILRKYFSNYKEYNFKKYLLQNYLNFEKRLDFNIYKAHFVKSLYESRFFIVKGFILVNNRKITTFNYLLKKNDKVEINPKFFNLVLNSINFLNFNNIYYIKNLEIDYKTLSFIFLDKKEFYILNYRNFFKHIYCLHHNKFQFLKKYENVNNELETKYIKNNIFYNNNKYIRNPKLNNFFKFFDYILKYYVFLDKKHIFLKKRNYRKFFLTNYESKILIKFLKKKYNNFYFRNILLKRIFNYKYNYLYFINNIFPNFYNFENINYILNNNFKNIMINSNITNINFQYFKYYYNIIFKYYIYLLQNYYIYFDNIKLNYTSFNNYNHIIFFNLHIFKILYLKNKLNNYYLINYNKILNLNNNQINNKFKILKYKYIKHFTVKVPYNRKKIHYYLTNNSYINFLYYISSKNFRLKYYKYTWNKHIQNLKKYDILKKFSNSFIYKYYNISKFGIYPKLYTKRYIFSNLIYNKNLTIKYNINKKNSKFNRHLRFLLKNHLYLSVTSDIYKFVYNFVIQSQVLEKNQLKNNFFMLNSLIKDLNLNKKIYKDILKNLKLQYYILNNNKNFNYNINIKNLYLLINLIKFYKKNIYDYNLKHNNYFTVLYKSSLKRNKYRFFNYSIFVRRRDRILIEPIEKRINIYIKYNKPKLILSSNLRKYFLINQNVKKKKVKFFCSNLKFKKLNKQLNKYKQNFVIKKTKQNLNYIFNLNIIDSNFKFNDSLFFKDLFLNLTTRKLNVLYNLLRFNKFNKNILINFNTKNLIFNKNNKLFIRQNDKNNHLKYYYFLSYNNIYKYNQNLKKYVIVRKLNTSFKIQKNKDLKFYNLNLNNNKLKYKTNYYIFKNFRIKKNIYNKKYIILSNNKLFNQNKFNNKIYNPYSSKYFYKFNKNIINIYFYYSFFYRKYKIIKYIFNNYIFKEYLNILDNYIINNISIKNYNYSYIKQLYFNLLYSEIFNFKKYDYLFKNNFKYSRKLKIIINYLILINRFYK
nr:ribosomal protein S4 [Blastocystis sp. subtype 9]